MYENSAIIINPYSEIGFLTIKSLTDSGIATSLGDTGIVSKKILNKILSEPLVSFLPKNFEPDLKKFLYFIFFVTSKNDIQRLKELLSLLPAQTKKVIVAPLDLGVEDIQTILSATLEKLVVVPSGFTTFPAHATEYLFTKILFCLSAGNEIQLNPDDATTLSFSSLSETSKEIFKVLFTGRKGSTYWLIPQPFNLATVVAIIQNQLPLTVVSRLIFSQSTLPYDQKTFLPPGINYWTPKTKPEEAIREIINKTEDIDEDLNVPRLTPAAIPLRQKTTVSPSPSAGTNQTKIKTASLLNLVKIFKTVFKLMLGLSFAIVFATVIYIFVIAFNLFSSVRLVESNSGLTVPAVTFAQRALRQILTLDRAVILLQPIAKGIGLTSITQQVSSQISSAEILIYTEISTLKLLNTVESSLIKPSQPQLNQPKLAGEIDAAIANVTLSRLVLSSELSWTEEAPLFGAQTARLKSSLGQLRSFLVTLQKSEPFLLELGAYDHPRKYLVLFQNNMELRPTGGFIGSYGLLTVSRGKIVSLEVKDVYAADGQLKGHVEPPAPIKTVLGEASWMLRDSNWDPDFPTSAQRAQWFLEKETGETVDGTIAITLNLAKNILSALGPVRLSDYQETIDQNNLFQRAQYHAEANFFPGSTQKKDFLAALSQAMLDRLKSTSPTQLPKLLDAYTQASVGHDIQVYMNDPSLESFVDEIGLSGKLYAPPSCQISNCLPDYLFILDSNLGVNKDNFVLAKKFYEEITLSDKGNLSHSLTLTFSNQAKSETWPLGRYKTYLRIYLPEGTDIGQISVKDPTSGTSRIVDSPNYSSEHGLKVVGFPLEIPISQSRDVELSYQFSKTLNMSKDGAYILFLRKQAGTGYDPFEIIFTGPPGITITPSSTNPNTQYKTFDLPNSSRYNFALSADQQIRSDIHQAQN